MSPINNIILYYNIIMVYWGRIYVTVFGFGPRNEAVNVFRIIYLHSILIK